MEGMDFSSMMGGMGGMGGMGVWETRTATTTSPISTRRFRRRVRSRRLDLRAKFNHVRPGRLLPRTDYSLKEHSVRPSQVMPSPQRCKFRLDWAAFRDPLVNGAWYALEGLQDMATRVGIASGLPFFCFFSRCGFLATLFFERGGWVFRRAGVAIRWACYHCPALYASF